MVPLKQSQCLALPFTDNIFEMPKLILQTLSCVLG